MGGLVGAEISPDDGLSDDDWGSLAESQRAFIKKRVDMMDKIVMEMLDRYGLPRDPEEFRKAGYLLVQDIDRSQLPNSTTTYQLAKIIETHTIETKVEGTTMKIIVDGGEKKL